MALTDQQNTLQLLSFTLDEEVFAVEISRVREVLEFKGTTKVPKLPDFMRGVINLRGSVVPVMDLRLKFGLSETERGINTCIIVVEVEQEGEILVVGALADSVQEVFELEPGEIEPAPRIGTRLKTDFILGMGNRDGQFIMILDIDKIFNSGELGQLVDLKEVAA